MNERIKEIEKQCWQSTQSKPHALFDVKKFAELIVKEMLQTCEDHPAWTGRMIGEQIRKHFGVEE
jgi:hypothetical protein